MSILTPSQIAGYVLNAGFTGENAIKATAIALAESSGNTSAYNPNDPAGGSFGLFQINGANLGNLSPSDLNDPAINSDKAYSLFSQQGFEPWSTYTSGAYQAYLGQAQEAVNDYTSNAMAATVNAQSPASADPGSEDVDSPSSSSNSSVTASNAQSWDQLMAGADSPPSASSIEENEQGTQAAPNTSPANGDNAGTIPQAIDALASTVGGVAATSSGTFKDYFSRGTLVILGIVFVAIALWILGRPSIQKDLRAV